MKKLIPILFLAIALFTFAQPAHAHFLATDGSIGAVLHVDPNDEPIAGSQASFFFEFKDKENKFKPENCDCTFEIDQNGKNIYSQPLFQNNSNPSLSNASVFYTFPQKDVYQIKVVGKPLTPHTFQQFTLTWDFRVDQQAGGQAVLGTQTNFFAEHVTYLVLIGVLLIGFLIYFLSNTHKRKKQTMKGGDKKHDEKDIGTIY